MSTKLVLHKRAESACSTLLTTVKHTYRQGDDASEETRPPGRERERQRKEGRHLIIGKLYISSHKEHDQIREFSAHGEWRCLCRNSIFNIKRHPPSFFLKINLLQPFG